MRIILGVIIVLLLLTVIGIEVRNLKKQIRIRTKVINCLVEHTLHDRETLIKMSNSELEKVLDKILEERLLRNHPLKFDGNGFATIVPEF